MKGILSATALFLSIASSSFALTYTGSLSTTDNTLFATQPWSQGSTLSWEVSSNNLNGWWTYEYTFSVPEHSISHVIVETSSTFTAANIKTGTTADYELGTFSGANGNPGLDTNTIYGLKWNTPEDEEFYELVWTIVSDRKPMWGDFYSKDGKLVPNSFIYAYNSGLGYNTTSALSDGNALDSFGHAWALVPDTTGGTDEVPVPEPGTIALLGLGLVGIGLYRRNKKQ